MNHKHLIVDFEWAGLSDVPTVIDFLNDLVKRIDMKVFMEPRARFCSSEGNIGTTGDVVIETSHASIHLWDDFGYGRFDLYSCKDFHNLDVLDCICDYFGKINVTNLVLLDRNPK